MIIVTEMGMLIAKVSPQDSPPNPFYSRCSFGSSPYTHTHSVHSLYFIGIGSSHYRDSPAELAWFQAVIPQLMAGSGVIVVAGAHAVNKRAVVDIEVL